ncbi:glycosyltransferase [Pseudoalteromonas sp.]|uniref:glycosyltransferase n=1 Tax=Pseudoalteromonas sp. TaxID=53249 RepID=UPI003518868B
MTIIAFMAEPFYKEGDNFLSSKASINFVNKCFENEEVVCVGSQISTKPLAVSSIIRSDYFEVVPEYKSILDFSIRSLKNPFYFFNYIKRCNQILDKYPDAMVWARNPSIGPVLFSICAIVKKRILFNHLCANGMKAWDNVKYTGGRRVLAYLFSHCLTLMVKYISKSKRTLNLCTGSELEFFCKEHNTNTCQFIDSNILNIKKIIKDRNKSSPLQFLFIGRVQEDKGIYELLSAFEELPVDNFTLSVIGNGEALDELQSKYELSQSITFLGPIPNHLLSSYIDKSDCLIVPSKNKYEGFPRVILEGWSRSTPVIVSDVGGIHSFVKHMDNALIYDGSQSKLIEAMKVLKKEGVLPRLQKGAIEMSELTTESFWVERAQTGISKFLSENTWKIK